MRRFELAGKARMALVAFGVLLVGVLLGAALRGVGSPNEGTPPARTTAVEEATTDDAESSTQSDSAASAGPGPTSSVAGVGVGFDQSETGAVAAAMSYSTASQSWLYLDDEELTDAVNSVVAPDAQEEVVPQVVEDLRLLRDELGSATGTVWYVVSPLATHLESYSADRAVVNVWVVRVLSADGVAVPQSGWETVRLELAWHDDWRVADVHVSDGPVPQLEAGVQPWAASYLDETLAGFLRVGVL